MVTTRRRLRTRKKLGIVVAGKHLKSPGDIGLQIRWHLHAPHDTIPEKGVGSTHGIGEEPEEEGKDGGM